MGVLALLFWSSSIAVSRSLAEKLGPVSMPAYVYTLGGVLSSLVLLSSAEKRRRLMHLRPAYLFGCGGLFVLNICTLYLAIGLAAGRQQVLEVGIINYLWPSLTLAFAIPLLGLRGRPALALGVLLAFAGVALATVKPGAWSPESFRQNLQSNAAPYLLAAVAAVSWALYSNLSRRWAAGAAGEAVPLFLLAGGLIQMSAKLIAGETSRWNAEALGELGFLTVFPTMLAYVFWDRAMRKGRLVLVAALSYFIPLLSTLVSALYLHTPPGRYIWLACALVIAAAAVCKLSLREPETDR